MAPVPALMASWNTGSFASKVWANIAALAGLYYGSARLGYTLEFSGAVGAIVWLVPHLTMLVTFVSSVRPWNSEAVPLTFQVLVSTDNETWTLATNTVHPYAGEKGGNQVDVNFAIDPLRARYVKYCEPPDGAWNGWGDFFQLRAYAEE